MKAISIQQPWGSLIAHGIKDIENRSRRMLEPPERVLIHVGSKMGFTFDMMPDCWLLPIENAEITGQFDRNAPLPMSAIIGYVDIVDIVEDTDSPWAQHVVDGERTMFHFQLKNAKLFKRPIYNVKGKIGIWYYPEINEDNLPETIDFPQITRTDKTLTIPLSKTFWHTLQENIDHRFDRELDLQFNLLKDNHHLFANDQFEPLDTDRLVFTHGEDSVEVDLQGIDIYDITNNTGEPYTYYDLANNAHIATAADIVFKIKP